MLVCAERCQTLSRPVSTYILLVGLIFITDSERIESADPGKLLRRQRLWSGGPMCSLSKPFWRFLVQLYRRRHILLLLNTHSTP
jgi:hypothetical protein